METQVANHQSWVIQKGVMTDSPRRTPAEAQPADTLVLLHKIATGDQQAMAAFYDATSAAVFGLAVRILQDQAAAEDAVIEVYNQVWTKASTYDTQRGSPMTWLLAIARSRSIDMLRARKRIPLAVDLESAQEIPSLAIGPETETIASERRRFVHKALEGLHVEQRQTIELAYFSDLSHSQIATRLGQPLGTVKTRIRSGMLQLRERLRPLIATYSGEHQEKGV